MLPKKVFGYLHPKFHTPVINILAIGVVGLIGIANSVSNAVSFINFGAFTAFTFVNFCVIALAIRNRRFRTPVQILGNAVAPLIGAGFDIWLLTQLDWRAHLLGGCWLVIGIGLSDLHDQGIPPPAARSRLLGRQRTGPHRVRSTQLYTRCIVAAANLAVARQSRIPVPASTAFGLLLGAATSLLRGIPTAAVWLVTGAIGGPILALAGWSAILRYQAPAIASLTAGVLVTIALTAYRYRSVGRHPWQPLVYTPVLAGLYLVAEYFVPDRVPAHV